MRLTPQLGQCMVNLIKLCIYGLFLLLVLGCSPEKKAYFKNSDAFLNLSLDNPEDKKILDNLNATHFVPVGLNEFDVFLNTVPELNM